METWRPLRQVRVHPLTVDGAVPVLSFCELPSDNLYPKPIPRWDVHFGILKTTEWTPQLLVSPLSPTWVATDSAA